MKKIKKNIMLKNFHHSQIGRAQRFIRMNSSKYLTLKLIAKEAGASPFHFGRLFMAYTGETTFKYLRRIRLFNALKILQEDASCSVTEIAMSVGYETVSSFNKIFKLSFEMSPTDFRNLDKTIQENLINRTSETPVMRKTLLNLTKKIEVVKRSSFHFVYVEKSGIFKEVAMSVWLDLIPKIDNKLDKKNIVEYLGMSLMGENTEDEASMFYAAGVSVSSYPSLLPEGLKVKTVSGGKYAKFILIGSTSGVWSAFENIFRILVKSKIKLRSGPCLENYLSNPELIPENDLVTELFVPIL